MKDSKRLIVLETNGQVDILKNVIEYISLSNPELELRQLSQRDASVLMYHLIKELVDGKLAFKADTLDNSYHIISLLFGIPLNKITAKHSKIYKQLTLEPSWSGVIFTMEKQIANSIEFNDWTEWEVVKVGNLVALVEGQDYRISQFHKETAALNEDDEAVVTLNCVNPINYIHQQFIKTYSQHIHSLRHYLLDPTTSIDPFFRKVLTNFSENPTEYMSSLFLATLVEMQPNVELDVPVYGHNNFIERALGIYDISSFKTNVVAKVITAFVLGFCKHRMRNDENYVVEYYPHTHIIALFKKQFSQPNDKYEAELVNSLRRGDYLPERERVLAEQLALTAP